MKINPKVIIEIEGLITMSSNLTINDKTFYHKNQSVYINVDIYWRRESAFLFNIFYNIQQILGSVL